MPQLHECNVLSASYHLLCPNCLNPMHIRTAQVSTDGRESVRFVCGSCQTAVEREYAADR
jgi:hypothetical protein